jgi:erythromycin esterase
MRALDRIIGTAHVVGLAEFAHLQPECLELRNRLFEHLVEAAGFTAIAAETSFTRSIAVDDYVLGHGDARPTQSLVHDVFSWSPHAVTENGALIEWMRAHNALPSTKRKIRFYGIDLTGVRPRLDLYEHAREGVDAALAYVARLDPKAAVGLSRRLQPGLARFNNAEYATMSTEERAGLTVALAELNELIVSSRDDWLERTTPLEYQRARLSIRVGLQHDANFRADPQGRRAGADRDAAMAANLEWVLEQEGRGGRVLLFASLNHLTKGPNEYYGDAQLGIRIASRLRGGYAVIGTYWPRAVPDATTSVDSLLRPIATSIDSPLAFLDLRSRPPDARWRSARGPADSFVDAVVFVRPTTDAYSW